MNSKKLERLGLLLKIAGQKTHVSALLYAKAHQALQREQQGLQQLEQYQKDYMDVMLAHIHKKTTTLQLKTDQRFLAHLSDVIKQQGETLDSVIEELDKRKALWVKCNQREKALKTYFGKVKEQEQLLQDEKEQKESDLEITTYWFHQKARSK